MAAVDMVGSGIHLGPTAKGMERFERRHQAGQRPVPNLLAPASSPNWEGLASWELYGLGWTVMSGINR